MPELEKEVIDRIKQIYVERYNTEIDDEYAEEVWDICKILKKENWI